jgi:DNA (cytosine-5)-methyltransferase 1
MNTALTFFSGAGGACRGLINAGFEIIGGNEYDPLIAAIWRLNHQAPLDSRDIRKIPLIAIPKADLYWFSPPCPEFSIAKIGRNGGTEAEDTTIAKKMAWIIATKKPRYIVIENVEGYARSKSLVVIKNALFEAGYKLRQQVVNAADLGTPQTRRRLIIRAELGRMPDRLSSSHSKDFNPDQLTLFGQNYRPWVGWHDAIKDLFPSMQPTHLTDRQIEQIKIRGSQLSRAVLVQRLGYNMKRRNHVRQVHEPVWTITASCSSDGKKNKHGFPSWRSVATVAIDNDSELIALKVDRRCLARFQGFPDSYQWGEHETINCKAIGNAVPVQMAEAIGKGFLEKIGAN